MQEYLTRLKFVYQGKVLWETSSSNVPGMIMLKRGENIEGKLRESEKPQYGLYDRVELPKFLQKPGEANSPGGGGTTLGSSQVTAAGIR